MAISNVINSMSKDDATKKAPVTPPAQGNPAKTSNNSAKTDAFKEKGAAIRQQMSEDERSAEGTKSDKVAFVCSLGDPNRKQSRVDKHTNVPSHVVVGYKFKVLEDMLVPKAPWKPGFTNSLDYENPVTMVEAKAGDIVQCTIPEMAMFISRPEFAGKFTGEGKGVFLSAAASQNNPVPMPTLKLIGSGSVKESMELVADMVGGVDGKKGTPKIKPEYEEKFGVLYAKTKISRGGKAGGKDNGSEASANLAAAFRAHFDSLKAN